MGLISRVSSRTYRKMLRLISRSIKIQKANNFSTSAFRFPPKKKGKAGGKGGGKKGADKGGEFSSPIINDPKLVQTQCIGLQLEDGAAELSLKPDEEYPDWLWQMSSQPKYLPEHFKEGTEDYY